ncbi:hypothetical protein WMO24_03840 [Ruthenibacterium sp. CLA-JM-H11]|uniref:DUF4830 domain-containing protein n=1 Tax=Ruthenibacterium intestinale TaxID=3133163 RepID=A0ABV1GCJ6_9FIRM
MKKKRLAAGLLVLAAIGLFVYFRPLPLADTLNGSDQLLVLLEQTTIENGKPHMEVSQYDRLTPEQQDLIRALFADATYHRTLHTPFSDGSTRKLSDRVAYVHTFDENAWVATVYFSEAGELSANYRTHRLNDASQLMEELAKICQ